MSHEFLCVCSDCEYYELRTGVLAEAKEFSFGSTIDSEPNPIVVIADIAQWKVNTFLSNQPINRSIDQ